MAYSSDMSLMGVLVNFTQKINTHNNNIDIYLIQGDSIITHCSA